MKGRAIPYSAEELAWLKANCRMACRAYGEEFRRRFSRDVSDVNLVSLRKRKGWMTGRTGRFVKGSVPANKGKPCPPGRGGNSPAARRTQFRPGVRQGRAVKLYKPIGTERLSKEGYLERKIHDGMPFQSRWRMVHLIRWEGLHGPIPKGHALKCLDGDRRNTDPDNWELISRAVLARLNHTKGHGGLDYEAAPLELKPAILAIAKVRSARGPGARARA